VIKLHYQSINQSVDIIDWYYRWSFVKFCEILWIYLNYMEMGKFHGSAQNSVAHGKLWALVIMVR